jgi:Uma2 family endonuclease
MSAARRTGGPVRTRRWTRAEYDRLIEQGVFRHEERLELIDGELVVREPQGSRHYAAVLLVTDALRAAFGPGWLVRGQGPVALDEASEPEPDVSVVRGSPRDYAAGHPAHPVLVVEVADSTLAFDRRRKAALYARAGVADYWLLNLVDGALMVHREPAVSDSTPYGWRYRSVTAVRPPGVVSPLAVPTASVAVADLLP